MFLLNPTYREILDAGEDKNIWKLKQEELKEEGEAGVQFQVPLEC